MKQYKIYTHPSGATETVKQGWSWPAFFFDSLWAIATKMWGLGLGVIAGAVVLNLLIYATGVSEEARRLTVTPLMLILRVVFGLKGNAWREKSLRSRGFEFRKAVAAADAAENPTQGQTWQEATADRCVSCRHYMANPNWLSRNTGECQYNHRTTTRYSTCPHHSGSAEEGQASSRSHTEGALAASPSLARGRGASAAPNETALLRANELVNEYGAVLGRLTSTIVSESILPASKEEIKAALVLLALREKELGASPEELSPLRLGYTALADFVSASDAAETTSFDSLVASADGEISDTELLNIADKIARSGANAVDVKRQVADEAARLTAEFDRLLQR